MLGRRPRLAIAASLTVTTAAVAAIAIRADDDGGPTKRDSTGASCAVTVEWRGTTYYGTNVKQPLSLRAPLDHGSIPVCNDTPGNDDGSAPQPLALAEIAGMPTVQAVASADQQTLYLAPGYFPQLAGTPLHDAIYGSRADVPDERGKVCLKAPTTELRARIQGAGFGNLRVELDDPGDLPRQTWIFSDAGTLVEGGGTPPHVNPGDTVRARVLVCRNPDDPHFLKLVATRLAIGE